MAKKVLVTRKHGVEPAEALKRLQELTGDLEQKFGVTITPTADGATVAGKGVKGTATVRGADVTVDLDLGLPASLAAKKIEISINRYMDRYFA
ncbi:polyhydroxyalkanoic acid system family protein [Myxococcota bacterium]|nr:polyhydroxyalkanoic acid system family protein [Myxococcota bacterium]MBU1429860.1 polyhydroxyalkanoic acid system family protein [Myxococcota bacterium]MBU1896462.1 polyhydroxyalkanoic acid system family protein [Myxococcota bacterium]